MILHHLRHDPKSLSRLLRVHKKWFFLLVSHLWLHGDPEHLQASYVKTHKRRTLYASSIRSIHFWSHEKFWNGLISCRPVFSNIRSLELFDTALRMNPAQDLVPFLSATLERLVIYADGSYTLNKPEQGSDGTGQTGPGYPTGYPEIIQWTWTEALSTGFLMDLDRGSSIWISKWTG